MSTTNFDSILLAMRERAALTRADVRAPKSAVPSRPKRMTWDRLAELVAAGYGSGHLEQYKSWDRIGKRDYSDNSNVGHYPSGEPGRLYHYNSRQRLKLYNALSFAGCMDVRDGYPAWPWQHPHPISGLMEISCKETVAGTSAIAAELQVRHQRYDGTNIPKPYTFAAMGTWFAADGRVKLTAYLLDSRSQTNPGERLRTRHREMLILSKYCEAAQIPLKYVGIETLPKELFTVLAAIRPQLGWRAQAQVRESVEYRVLVRRCEMDSYSTPITEILNRSIQQVSCHRSTMLTAFHIGLWSQEIDHDLTQPLEFGKPLRPGGRRFRNKLRAVLS